LAETRFHCISFWCIMMNPCFITSNNTTQKFILFFLIPSDKKLTGINSLLLVFVGQLLWDSSGRYFGKFQMLVDDCLNRTNTQAQFVRYPSTSRTVTHLSARMQVSTWLIRYCRTWCSSTNIITNTMTTAAKAGFKH